MHTTKQRVEVEIIKDRKKIFRKIKAFVTGGKQVSNEYFMSRG